MNATAELLEALSGPTDCSVADLRSRRVAVRKANARGCSCDRLATRSAVLRKLGLQLVSSLAELHTEHPRAISPFTRTCAVCAQSDILVSFSARSRRV